MKTLNFKSKEAYRKWLAYGNIHKAFKHKGHYPQIEIGGKPHKVRHLW